MTKRRISLALVVTMLLTLMMPTLAFGADYSGHWAEKTIQEWFDNDKLKGYEDGSFRPNAQITRAEFMTMVNNAFGYTEKAEVSFTDVDSDDWFYPEVQKAVKAGYLLGYEDNSARPGNKITRQEAALIIARIKDLSDYASGANIFDDASKIAIWAKGGVGAVTRAKYMIGYEDSTFRPERFISRAEALVTIDRAYEESEPTTGGGSGGGITVTTAAAIISNFEIVDENGNTKVITPSAITSGTAFTTTSTAITITTDSTPSGAKIEFTVTSLTSPSAIVTTGTAIDGVIDFELPEEAGDYEVSITVFGENKRVGSKRYTDNSTYVFIITKE